MQTNYCPTRITVEESQQLNQQIANLNQEQYSLEARSEELGQNLQQTETENSRLLAQEEQKEQQITQLKEEIELLKTVINLIIAEQDNKKENTLYHKSLVEAWSLLGSAYTLINETTNAVEAFIKCSLLEENKLQRLIEYSNALFTANYSEKISAEEKFSLHLKYNDFFDDSRMPHHHYKAFN